MMTGAMAAVLPAVYGLLRAFEMPFMGSPAGSWLSWPPCCPSVADLADQWVTSDGLPPAWAGRFDRIVTGDRVQAVRLIAAPIDHRYRESSWPCPGSSPP